MDNHDTPSNAPAAHEPPTSQRTLARGATMIYGIGALFVAGLAAATLAYDALLLIFACILFAILLYKLSDIAHRRLGLNRTLALTLVVLLLAAIIGLGSWAMAPQISEQSSQLAKEVPAAIERLQSEVERHPLMQRVVDELPAPEEAMKQLGSMMPNAGLLFGGVLGALGNVVIIIFVGIYFAAAPGVYTGGFIRLIPQAKRGRARQVLDEMGDSLASWLLGKAVSMLIVGSATAIGLSLLGVPLALILGIIAGLLDFIPYIGPIMAGVPAVLLALSISPDLALYALLLFAAINMLEGYVLQPMIEARAIELPPALVIVMQLIFGTLFGFAGVALATPLAAVLSVLVKMLYIEDILGDRRPREAEAG